MQYGFPLIEKLELCWQATIFQYTQCKCDHRWGLLDLSPTNCHTWLCPLLPPVELNTVKTDHVFQVHQDHSQTVELIGQPEIRKAHLMERGCEHPELQQNKRDKCCTRSLIQELHNWNCRVLQFTQLSIPVSSAFLISLTLGLLTVLGKVLFNKWIDYKKKKKPSFFKVKPVVREFDWGARFNYLLCYENASCQNKIPCEFCHQLQRGKPTTITTTHLFYGIFASVDDIWMVKHLYALSMLHQV